MIKNKILKILIAIILLIVQTILITAKVNAANIGEVKDLERGELGYYCVQKWNGNKWIYLTYNQTFYTDTDGQKYLAYCLSPGNPGVGYVSGEKETYQVRINELLNNDVIWRVLKNGYPNKSVEELGVETADDAYFATMQAINSILRGYSLEQAKELYSVGQFAINAENYEDIQRRGAKTLDTLFKLIDIGLNGTETRIQFLDISVKPISELHNENKDYYSQTFRVSSSAEISNYKVDKIEGLPENSYVTDLHGNAKESFENGEDFKVMINKKDIADEIKGNISLKVIQKNYPIYYGVSQIEGFQDYALCNNSYSEVCVNAEIYAPVNKSKLSIVKIDSETKKPMKGVKFEIECTDGTQNTYITDANGKIIIANQRPGIIKIKEIQTLEKYRINKKVIEVELEYNQEKEIEIRNEKQRGNIKVIKVDKDDNEIKIEGVEFQLKDENDNIVKTGKTDKNGEVLFEKLLVGKYKLIETETNSEYLLQDEEVNVEVIDNKTQEVKIENEKIKIPEEIVEEKEDNPIVEIKKLPKTGNVKASTIASESMILVAFLGIRLLLKKSCKILGRKH